MIMRTKVKFLTIGVQESVEDRVNTALRELEKRHTKILDVKFLAKEHSNNALIIYEEIEKEE